MNKITAKVKGFILPALMFLFVLEVLIFPEVVKLSYAGRSESPDHILTYTKGELTWDNNTRVKKDGSGELSLFQDAYSNVESDNGSKVIAPGTDGFNIVRLKNDAPGNIKYNAVLYEIKSDERIPVKTDMFVKNSSESKNAHFPKGISKDSIIKSYEGTLAPGTIEDFDISWIWEFTEDELQDITDTELADISAIDESKDITVGIYVTVEDNNSYVTPRPPKTGDNQKFASYITFLCISAFILLIIISRRISDKKRERN